MWNKLFTFVAQLTHIALGYCTSPATFTLFRCRVFYIKIKNNQRKILYDKNKYLSLHRN